MNLTLPPFSRVVLIQATVLMSLPASSSAAEHGSNPAPSSISALEDGAEERPDDPYIAVSRSSMEVSPGRRIDFRGRVSVQVNVDEMGNNMVGDAANEPSITVDPTNPQRMAVGWRQFDTIASNFRQAGYAYTTDGGQSWTFPGVIEPGVFRSDPVLDFDADGKFYYNSLTGDLSCDVFRSADAGTSWDSGVESFGGDKQWMSIDRTSGVGRGNIYQVWYNGAGCCFPNSFTRSTDGGASFESPIEIGDGVRRGTTSVGPDGAVYVVGHLPTDLSSYVVAKSTTLADPQEPAAFDSVTPVNLGGPIARAVGPNPGGMLGQIWIVADPLDADRVYILASIDPPGTDPLDIHFGRSVDGGATWSAPIRLNDDPTDNDAWQWFGTLSIAPNGRLDAVWNDTRDDPKGFDSVLYYASSADGGLTWSAGEPLTPAWDPLLGFPQQNKIGDYYDMVSHNDAAHLIYAATFNGEQDVYYLRIDNGGLFADGFESGDTTAWSSQTGRAASP